MKKREPRPTFLKLADARAFLVPDVIARAAAPFRDMLTPSAFAELTEYLEDLAATHPRIRTLATRAATSFLPPKKRGKAAARDEDEGEGAIVIDIASRQKTPLLPPGGIDLAVPAFHAVALATIHQLAARYAPKTRVSFDDLVGAGWLVAVEIAPKFNARRKTAFRTFLWTCVRRRLRDIAVKSSNRCETPFSSVWPDTVTEGDLANDDPVEGFQEGMNAAATAFALGMTDEAYLPPDVRYDRAEKKARLKAAIAELPKRHQRLLALVYFEGLTIPEAAARIGVAERNARIDHTKALQTLHRKLARSHLRLV
jgi:RNA polymerase sigma factor (sigma-70 family)